MSSNPKIVFVGCSYTNGIGLPLVKEDENLWVNIVANTCFADCDLDNQGAGALNNVDIFLNALKSLTLPNLKYLIVAWTEIYRMCVNPGVEVYATNSYWAQPDPAEINLNPGITYSTAYLKNIRDRFFDLNHPHYEILKVLEYSKIIFDLCQTLGIKVFFVNSLMPWDKDYFVQQDLSHNRPLITTKYTQKILNLDTRDDNEYTELYRKIHANYNILTPTKNYWLNLDQSFRQHFDLDRGDDGLHPGPISHRKFGNFLVSELKKHNLSNVQH